MWSGRPLGAEGPMARPSRRAALPLGVVGLLSAALAATAGASTSSRRGASAGTVNVAFIYSKTGGLAAFGQEELDGFQAGLAYTKGKCGGHTVNPTYVDDPTDAATAARPAQKGAGA